MSTQKVLPPAILRFVAMDLHKHYLMIGAIDAAQRVVLQPRKLPLEKWLAWAQANLQLSDAVVIEATTNAWVIYDQLVPLVGKVVVANARKVKQIAETRVKTDRHDVLIVAQLLRADLIPEVWVPPVEVRELRSLLAHRERLTRARATCLNRLQSVVHRLNLAAPGSGLDAQKYRAWWKQLPLSATERLRVEQDLALLDVFDEKLKAVDEVLAGLSVQRPWVEQMPYVLHIAGVGWLTALTVLAAVGDVQRFAHAKQLVGYAGLGASVHASGTHYQTGRITKEGRRELRRAMVEAAHAAIRCAGVWRRLYERLEVRLGGNKAVVAIARKLLVALWHVLHEREVEQEGDVDYIGITLWCWGRALSDEQRGGLTRTQWTRAQLIRLGIGHERTHIVRGTSRRRLPTVEEVLALWPELAEEGGLVPELVDEVAAAPG